MNRKKLNTPENIKLIKKGIEAQKPDCSFCPVRDCCCGCADAMQYSKAIKPFKKAGIFEYFEQYDAYEKNAEHIRTLKKKNARIKKSLTESGFGDLFE